MNDEQEPKPLVDEVFEHFDPTKGKPVTEAEHEHIQREMEKFDGEIGEVCARLTDGRIICVDCFWTKCKDEPLAKGEHHFLILTPAFRFMFESNPVCALCERIISEDTAHIRCYPEEGVRQHIRTTMEQSPMRSKDIPPDVFDQLVELMYQELRWKGVYTDCTYHEGSVIATPKHEV